MSIDDSNCFRRGIIGSGVRIFAYLRSRKKLSGPAVEHRNTIRIAATHDVTEQLSPGTEFTWQSADDASAIEWQNAFLRSSPGFLGSGLC